MWLDPSEVYSRYWGWGGVYPVGTRWVHGEFWSNSPIQYPLSTCKVFFFKVPINFTPKTLSHSSRVLSQSTHWWDYNIPTEFFFKELTKGSTRGSISPWTLKEHIVMHCQGHSTPIILVPFPLRSSLVTRTLIHWDLFVLRLPAWCINKCFNVSVYPSAVLKLASQQESLSAESVDTESATYLNESWDLMEEWARSQSPTSIPIHQLFPIVDSWLQTGCYPSRPISQLGRVQQVDTSCQSSWVKRKGTTCLGVWWKPWQQRR